MDIKIITVIFAGIAGVTLSVKPNRFCYKDYPILDGLLCYKECESGYSHWGGGPLCWGKCSPRTTNIGLLCIKNSYGRGVGKPLSACKSGYERNWLLCYPNCKNGYYGVGPLCWAYCKSEYHDDGALCRKNVHIYGRDVGSCPWYDKCGLCAGPWYNVCGKRRKCGKSCKPGYKNDGCTCRRDVHIYAKHTYGRGVGVPMICKSSEEKNAALCYPPCESGYYGVGPVCWASCSGQTIDTGTQCQKKAYGRGVGKVVNCLKPPSTKDITNFDGLVNLFEKANGFKNLQAAGCSTLFAGMKRYTEIIQTFNSCFAKGNWQTISLSYSAGVAIGTSISGEIGLAADTKNTKAICYVGYCTGVKLDVSIGASIAIGWWKSLDDISGLSSAYELGVDLPFTEIGPSVTFITNDKNVYIGTQFSFGLGVGLLLFDVGFSSCSTPKNEIISINI